MADKRINKDDIADKGLFDHITQGAKAAQAEIKTLTLTVNTLKQAAQGIKKGLGGASVGNTQGMKDFDQLAKQANQTAKAKLAIDKDILREKEKLKVAQQQQNKEIREEVALANSQKGSLERVRLESKKLRNEKEKLDLTTKKGNQRLKIVNKTLDRNNKILEKNATKLGKQKMAIGRYQNALRGLTRVLGQLGVAFGVFSLLKDSFNVVKDFEQSQANLKSIITATDKELKKLTAQTRELGATTTFTAAQVTELQTELAKLGFVASDIEEMTPGVLSLAEATGTDLANAASVAGATMRGFGLEAKDSQKVVDVMAKSFSASSLDMEKFKTAMAAVAPIAKTMGFSIEETTAMIGSLTDAGLDASTAGTSLRNMMLEASKQGLTWQEALDKVNNSTDKAGTALELFGKRGVAAGVILAENQKKVGDLTESLEDSAGAAEKMAEVQRDTLGGALKELRSAWEEYILGANEAGGASDKLKWIVQGLTKNLSTVLKVIGKVIKFFVIYKTTLAALKLQEKIKDQIAYNKSIKQGGEGALKATKGVKAFGAALKGIGLSIIITLVIELATAWLKVASGAQQAAKWSKIYGDAQKKGSKLAQARIDKVNKRIKEQVQLIQLQASEAKKAARTEQERQNIDKQAQKDIEALTLSKEEGLKADISRVKAQKILALEAETEAKRIRDEFLKQQGGRAIILSKEVELTGSLARGYKEVFGGAETASQTLTRLDNAVLTTARSVGKTTTVLDLYRTELSSTTDEVIGFKIAEGDSLDVLNGGNEKLKQRISLLREIEDVKIDLIDDDLDREKTALEVNARRRIENTKKKETNAIELAEFIKVTNEKLQADLLAADKEALEARRIAALEAAREARQQILDLEESFEAETESDVESLSTDDLFLERQKDKRLELLKDENLSSEELEREFTEFLIKELKIRLELEQEAGEETIDTEIKLAELERKHLEDNEKEKFDIQKDAIDLTTQLFTDSIDKKIAKLDEEVEAHKKRADDLAELAKNGNITAKESLAEENRLIAEAEAKKAELEKRKQRIQMVSSILLAYNSNLEQGDESGTALAKAITSKSVLDQFISSIGSFYDGTEDTGRAGNALDSKGGRFAVLHDNERVMTAKQNSMMGNVSNDEVARVMEDRRLGRLVDGNQVAVGWENIMLVEQLNNVSDKLDMVNKTIENKPETNIQLGAITQKTMEIVESRRKGGLKTVSTFKVKPQ